MKLYIVTEENTKNNLVLNTWVCFTKEQAQRCLAHHFEIACAHNHIEGQCDPTNCLEHGFFFWQVPGSLYLKYRISEAETYEG